MKEKLVPEKETIEKIIIPFLRDYLGYDTDLMKRQFPLRFGGKTGTKFADLVFFVVIDDLKKPFLVVEAKALGKELDWLQAESYAQRIDAPYFVLSDGETWSWFKTGKKGQGTSKELITEIHPPKTLGGAKLVKFSSIPEARNVIRFCHDVVWNEKSATPEDALKELSKFFIAKVIDEREVQENEKEDYDFKIKKKYEDVIDIKNRINLLLMKAKRKDPELFVDPSPEITLKPFSVIKIVEKLQSHSIAKTDMVETLGEVYQDLLKEVYTDRVKGQRFTPRSVVDFMVELIEPKLSETTFDPACGTGGFLVSTLRYIKDKIKESSEKGDLYDPLGKYREYGETKLYGTDIEKTVVQLAKANMLLHGDGHTHIICHDGLIDSQKTHPIQNIVKREGGFDIIITNPPFGGIKLDPEILVGYALAKHARSELTQVLFIERCLNLLKPGGKMAIVLPEGILNNLKSRYVRDFIMEKSIIKVVISLPESTFKPYGSGPKTSILFLKKKRHAGDKQGNILMGEIKNIGYTVSGKEEKKKDMPILLSEIKKLGGIKW